MKNRLFCLLLSCLFLLGNVSFAHSSHLMLDGGVIADIHNLKTGSVICSFPVPEKYLDKDGNLTLPLEISLMQDTKEAVFFLKSEDLNIDLPADLSGTYILDIRIGDYSISQKVTL